MLVFFHSSSEKTPFLAILSDFGFLSFFSIFESLAASEKSPFWSFDQISLFQKDSKFNSKFQTHFFPHAETILAHHPKTKSLEQIDWTPTEDRHYKYKVIEICKHLKNYSDQNSLLEIYKYQNRESNQMKFMLEDSQEPLVCG